MALFNLEMPPQSINAVPQWLATQYSFLQWILLNLDEDNLSEPYKARLRAIEKQIEEINNGTTGAPPKSDTDSWFPGDRLKIPPWTGAVAESFLSGTGQQNDPYIITTPQHLAFLQKRVALGDSYVGMYFKLQNNINLGNKPWTPIGSPENTFRGTFDGDYYTIFNLNIQGNQDNVGLFGYGNYGTVLQNIIVDGNVAGNQYVGLLLGYGKECKISNCCSLGSVTGNSCVGGIFGTNIGNVSCCSNSASVSATEKAGGIGGWYRGAKYNEGLGILYCYNVGTVSGTDHIGGIIGIGDNTVDNYNYGANTCRPFVLNCYNVGTVAGQAYTSGIGAGAYAYNYYTTFGNCYYMVTDVLYTHSYGMAIVGADMIAEDFVQKLNVNTPDAPMYSADTTNINSGFPVLEWQKIN